MLTAKPVVSIIMPTFNNAQHVNAAIESVLNQTYPHWELLIWNDGSQDNTRQILLSYLNEPRIRVFSAARRGYNPFQMNCIHNLLVRASNGQYLSMFGGAWLYHPEKLEKQVSCFEQEPELGLVHSNLTTIDTEGNVLSEFAWPNPNYAAGRILFLYLSNNFIGMPTVMIPKRVWSELGGIDPGSIADYDLWTRVMARYPVKYIHECLSLYRIHPQSQSLQPHVQMVYKYTLPRHVAHYYERYSLEKLMLPAPLPPEVVARNELRYVLEKQQYFTGVITEGQRLLDLKEFLSLDSKILIYNSIIESAIRLKNAVLVEKYIKEKEKETNSHEDHYVFYLDQLHQEYRNPSISYPEAQELVKQIAIYLCDHQPVPVELYQQLESIAATNPMNVCFHNQLMLCDYQQQDWAAACERGWLIVRQTHDSLVLYNLGVLHAQQGEYQRAKCLFHFLLHSDKRLKLNIWIWLTMLNTLESGMSLQQAKSNTLSQLKDHIRLVFVASHSDALLHSVFIKAFIDDILAKNGKVRLVSAYIKDPFLQTQSGAIPLESWFHFVTEKPLFSDIVIVCDVNAQMAFMDLLPHPIRFIFYDCPMDQLTYREMKRLSAHDFLPGYFNKLFLQPGLLCTNHLALSSEMQQDFQRPIYYLPQPFPTRPTDIITKKEIHLFISDLSGPVEATLFQSLLSQLKTTFSDYICWVCVTSTDLIHQLDTPHTYLFESEEQLLNKVAGSACLLYGLFGSGTPFTALTASMWGTHVYFITLDKQAHHGPVFSLPADQSVLIETLEAALQSSSQVVDHGHQWHDIFTEMAFEKTAFAKAVDYFEHLWQNGLFSPLMVGWSQATPVMFIEPPLLDLSVSKCALFIYFDWDKSECRQVVADYVERFTPTDEITLFCACERPLANNDLEAFISFLSQLKDEALLPNIEVLDIQTDTTDTLLHSVKLMTGVILLPEQPQLYFAAHLWGIPIIAPDQAALWQHYLDCTHC